MPPKMESSKHWETRQFTLVTFLFYILYTLLYIFFYNLLSPLHIIGFPCGSDGEKSACNAVHPSSVPGLESLLEKEMATHSTILARESHGQRRLVGYSP